MSEEESKRQVMDPFGQMVEFYDTWTKSWAKAMTEVVANKSFAETMGEQIEANLEAMSVMRSQLDEVMQQYLEQMNLPSRREVVTLAERLTRIEMALDDVDAKLDDVLDRLKGLDQSA
jgi:polyhydroxyalkanoic acid synthase PhaR subunit